MQQAARVSGYAAMMMIDDKRSGGVIELDGTKIGGRKIMSLEDLGRMDYQRNRLW